MPGIALCSLLIGPDKDHQCLAGAFRNPSTRLLGLWLCVPEISADFPVPLPFHRQDGVRAVLRLDENPACVEKVIRRLAVVEKSLRHESVSEYDLPCMSEHLQDARDRSLFRDSFPILTLKDAFDCVLCHLNFSLLALDVEPHRDRF